MQCIFIFLFNFYWLFTDFILYIYILPIYTQTDTHYLPSTLATSPPKQNDIWKKTQKPNKANKQMKKKQQETKRNRKKQTTKPKQATRKKKQKNFVEVVVETVESHLTLVYPLVLSSSLVNVHFHSNDSFGSGPLPSATQSITGSHWASLGYPVLFYVLSSMSSSFESVGPSPLHALVVHRWGECWVRPTHTLRSGIRW